MRILFLLTWAGLCLAQIFLPQLYPNYANRVEFQLLNGKTADPCANKEELGGATGAPGKTDCVGREWPEPAVLVLVPTLQSNANPNLQLTITGKNLVTGILALSQFGRSCVATEFPTAGTTLVTTINSVTSDQTSFLSFIIPAGWRSQSMELEHSSRRLCYQPNPNQVFRYTGWRIGAVWDCLADGTTAGRGCNSLPLSALTPLSSVAVTPNIVAPVGIATTDPLNLLSQYEQKVRSLRTTCCRHTTFGNTAVDLPVGQCINSRTATCCQGAAVDPTSMRCCNTAAELVQYYTQPCNCRPDSNPNSPSCPVNETCCTMSKYSELQALYTSSSVAGWPQAYGECYNATTHRCCDTGYRYDPGQDQCCNITGIQSLNVPCPCNADADCQGGQSAVGQGSLFGRDNSMYCCKMDWPDPFEFADSVISRTTSRVLPFPRCNTYNNYPSTSFPNTFYPIGSGPYQAQRCLGNCIDNRYQTCCNGVACRKEYETCCNTTCCNKFTSTCLQGLIPGTPNNKYNYNELWQPYELCTSIEVLNPLRSFWIFVWPAYLLFMTCVCLAFVIAFVSKVSRRSFSMLERSMITLAFFTIIFACACYFAPIYKYGVWVVIVSMFTIIVASARSKGLNIALVIVQFITLLYLFDPFNGNNYVGFAALRVDNGDPDPESAGVLHSIHKSFHSLSSFNSRQYCANYYNYFMKDPQLQDFRHDNVLVPSFGYCGHGWITALFIFEGFTLMLTLVQFVLDLIALILRFKEQRSYEPIELEVRGEDEIPMMYPAY